MLQLELKPISVFLETIQLDYKCAGQILNQSGVYKVKKWVNELVCAVNSRPQMWWTA